MTLRASQLRMADNKVITVGPLLKPKRKNILVQTNVLKSVGGFFTNGRLPYYFLYEQKKAFSYKWNMSSADTFV